MLQLFGYISGIISIFGAFPYIRDVILNKTKPQRSTWLIWCALGGIAFFSQLAKGATDSLWLTGIQWIAVVTICLLSISRGVGGLAKKDYIALGIASIGLVAWYFTKEAAFALYIIILIDFAGVTLTLHKAYIDPESETLITWVSSIIAGTFAMLAVGSWNIVLLSYPFYVVLVNVAVVSTILVGKQKYKTAVAK